MKAQPMKEIRTRLKRYPEPENKDTYEKLILGLYVFHTLVLLLIALFLHWNFQSLSLLCGGLIVCVYMRVKRHSTYTFRAGVTTALLWLNTAIYGFSVTDFIGMLPSVAAVIVVIGIYGLPNLMHIGNAFYTAMAIYHIFIAKNVSFSDSQEGLHTLLRILAVYFIQATVYYLVKMQRESNLRLLNNIESLHRVEHSKDDFMANVSHEIRTPVNTICGMSEIVLQNELPAEVRAYMFGIQTAGRNLSSIVSDILDFSELQSGNISIQNDVYNITSIVNDIINIANAKNDAKDLELIVDCAPDIPDALIGDRQKICRAVTNVVDNAIKFTDAGGVVINFSAREEAYGVNLCVTVRDTGIGIRSEVLEKIFTSFNQADTHRSRAKGGIGLGLAISKATVNKMGGFLNVKSAEGEGTEVSMVIPQGVKDKTPCISVKEPEKVHALVYLRLSNYKYPLIRSAYKKAIEHMALGFGITTYFCRNLAEFKRRMESGEVTHVFVGAREYKETPDYFETIAEHVQTTVVWERKYKNPPANSSLLCITAPFYALSIASILNGEAVRDISAGIHLNRFTAPEVHVLVVDDNPMNLKVVEGLLRPYRIKISTAQSGVQALEMLESRGFDFMFMDHMMPEMDGVETFRRIKARSEAYYQNLPVIALTANAVGNAREMFLSEGFADYISKPIEISALEHVLRKFIPPQKMVYAGKEIEIPQPVSDSAALTAPALGLDEQGINTAMGIGYCGGSMQDYLEILRMYCEGGAKNVRAVRRACADKDWNQYVILTHTIKSTSKSIGAAKLSELAAKLEAYGKEQRTDAIAKNTEEMLTEYERVLNVLRKDSTLFPPAPETAPAEAALASEAKSPTEAELTAVCDRLGELLQSFDGQAVADYLDEVGGQTHNGTPLKELLRPVGELAENFDFIGAEEALMQLRERERL